MLKELIHCCVYRKIEYSVYALIVLQIIKQFFPLVNTHRISMCLVQKGCVLCYLLTCYCGTWVSGRQSSKAILHQVLNHLNYIGIILPRFQRTLLTMTICFVLHANHLFSPLTYFYFTNNSGSAILWNSTICSFLLSLAS
jgi:hypothetical protein